MEGGRRGGGNRQVPLGEGTIRPSILLGLPMSMAPKENGPVGGQPASHHMKAEYTRKPISCSAVTPLFKITLVYITRF